MQKINPNYGDLMTIAEFSNAVNAGMFIDYDGFGYFANDEEYQDWDEVYPSEFATKIIPDWATHIFWFNR